MKKVLIIEDNEEISENTTEFLMLYGFEVIGAANGEEGISTAVKHLPDIILCDIMMPKVNGYDVLRSLKGDSSTAKIPFIYVTASAEKSEVMKAIQMGADGYVSKPYEVEALVKLINDCLDKKTVQLVIHTQSL